MYINISACIYSAINAIRSEFAFCFHFVLIHNFHPFLLSTTLKHDLTAAFMLSSVLISILTITASVSHAINSTQRRPNIVFILSDDQDKLLGSTDFQSVLQREIITKGVEFTQHYGTTAQCCPARASILRGQFSHNTNITHVNGPG